MNLILQGLLPPSLFVPSTEVPWHILFYYEPALITANSRIRYHCTCTFRLKLHIAMKEKRFCFYTFKACVDLLVHTLTLVLKATMHIPF